MMGDINEDLDEVPDVQEGEVSNEDGFQNVLNFRDVGKTINNFMGAKLVAEGILFRSARPDDATLDDRGRLVENLGIKTVMDLRTATEHAQQTRKREGQLLVPQAVQSNEALLRPFEIPGLEYLLINVNGKSFERSLIRRLSWWSLIKMGFLMLFRQRLKAISIMGREVLQPRGLIGLGIDTLDNCGSEIVQALRAISDPLKQPILIHCTQGKDRTGLIIALSLLILRVPVEAITYDYLLSEEALEPERESRLKEIASIGLNEEFANCPKTWVEEITAHLQTKYGGASEYCKQIGFSEEEERTFVAGVGV